MFKSLIFLDFIPPGKPKRVRVSYLANTILRKEERKRLYSHLTVSLKNRLHEKGGVSTEKS